MARRSPSMAAMKGNLAVAAWILAAVFGLWFGVVYLIERLAA